MTIEETTEIKRIYCNPLLKIQKFSYLENKNPSEDFIKIDVKEIRTKKFEIWLNKEEALLFLENLKTEITKL
jgi:hypothetical protein